MTLKTFLLAMAAAVALLGAAAIGVPTGEVAERHATRFGTPPTSPSAKSVLMPVPRSP